MDSYFLKLPHVSNKPKYLAEKAHIGLGTVQRTLGCKSGASIDTLEAIARVLGIPAYKLLMPSAQVRVMLSTDEQEEPTEELQRAPGRESPRRK